MLKPIITPCVVESPNPPPSTIFGSDNFTTMEDLLSAELSVVDDTTRSISEVMDVATNVTSLESLVCQQTSFPAELPAAVESTATTLPQKSIGVEVPPLVCQPAPFATDILNTPTVLPPSTVPTLVLGYPGQLASIDACIGIDKAQPATSCQGVSNFLFSSRDFSHHVLTVLIGFFVFFRLRYSSKYVKYIQRSNVNVIIFGF